MRPPINVGRKYHFFRVAPLRAYSLRFDESFGPAFTLFTTRATHLDPVVKAGESAALTTAITTAQEVMRTIGKDAEQILERQRPLATSMRAM